MNKLQRRLIPKNIYLNKLNLKFKLGGRFISKFQEGGQSLDPMKTEYMHEVVVFPKKKTSAGGLRTDFIHNYIDNRILKNPRFTKSEWIPFDNYYLNFEDVNVPKLKSGYSTIFGNTFVQTDNKNNVGTPNSFYEGLLIGDNNVPESNYSRWYGVENGKLRVGEKRDFGNSTLITPIPNKDNPITGLIDDNYDLGSIKDKFIIYQGNGLNAVGIINHDAISAINKYILQYGVNEFNPAHLIQMDGGRFAVNTTKDPAEYVRYDTPRKDRIWGITLK